MLSAALQSTRVVPDSLFALLFPTFCRVCQQPIERFTTVPVCEDCLRSPRPFEGLKCAGCGLFLQGSVVLHGTVYCTLCRRGAFLFQQARSFAWYEGNLRILIHLLKYNRFRPLARPLATLMSELLGEFEPKVFDLVLAVPLHSNRQHLRGFNQSELLAGHLARLHGVPLGTKDCVRVRDTRPQTGLRAAERRKNVAGAFHVPRPAAVRSRRVLLIDDVMTTGATANSCARALLEAGAEGVWVATLARVHRSHLDVL